MRKDFDYVDMRDYNADMSELSGQAANIISILTEQLAEAKRDHTRLLVAAVLAAGGTIKIYDRHMINAPDLKLTQWRDESIPATVLKIES